MAETADTDYLSIGEVLGLLLEEFPDVTISKIRFLESQGLISPERTPSGYRKFYEPDVDLLRVILTEQRQNYLPLRVIKDRLETGEIDPTGEHLRPTADEQVDDTPTAAARPDGSVAGPPDTTDDIDDPDPTPVEVPSSAIASHPASRRSTPSPAAPATMPPSRQARTSDATAPGRATDPVRTGDDEPHEGELAVAQLLPGVLLDRAEFLSMVGIDDDELDQLESFGVVTPRTTGGGETYDEDAVAIAKPAVQFLRAGIDARHLRNWRTSAEREASLYEQLVTPRFRQRNPEARAEALRELRRLDRLGANLRDALTRQVLRHHFDS